MMIYGDDGSGNGRGNSIPADGQWHHFVFTYDNTTGTMTIYIDGVYSSGVLGAGMGMPSSSVNVVVGNNGLGYTGYSSYDESIYGWIDGLAVWNRVLTQCEALYLYNNGSGITWRRRRRRKSIANAKSFNIRQRHH